MLRDEYGFDGQYTTVKDYVRENRRQTREMFVPLSHPPGHAQCDFGEALVVIGGVERKAHCFVLDLPHSDGCFVKAYPAETTEAFLDGHVSALSFLGGVPRSILYDNTRLAVAKILGDGRRPGSHQLRRRETPGAVPIGGPAAPAGPGAVSLPAQGEGQHYFYTRLYDSPHREVGMNDRSTLLLEHHLKELKLPSFLREYGKMAAQCAAVGVDHPQYLLSLAELELIDRHQRMVERRIRAARFPAVKSLDTFDFPTIPSLNKALVMELARCEYIQAGKTSSPSATAAPAKPTWLWGWDWLPARRVCRWVSPPPPHWSTK